MENNLVSIIMPVYNSSKYLQSSVQSVISQSYPNWELIIINDCSTDESEAIIQSLAKKDYRIKSLKLNVNSGVAKARNVGIALAKGRFLAFLDSDDLWHPEKLTKQVNFMLEKDLVFTHTSYQLITDSGKKKKIVESKYNELNFKKMLGANQIGCLTVMIDLSKIAKPVFPSIRHEDYALWLEILNKNHIKANLLKETLAYYRITPGSVSRNKIKSILWVWNIYHNYLKINTFKSSYLMLVFIKNMIYKYIIN